MTTSKFNKKPETTNTPAPAGMANDGAFFAPNPDDQDFLPLMPAGLAGKFKVLPNGYRLAPKRQGSNMGPCIYLDIELLELDSSSEVKVPAGHKCSARISGFQGTAHASAVRNNKEMIRNLFPGQLDGEDVDWATLPAQLAASGNADGKEIWVAAHLKQTKSFDAEKKQFRTITIVETRAAV